MTSTPRKTLTPAELKAVAPLALTVALRMLALFLLLPVIAPYVAGLPDGSTRLAGLAVGVYGLVQAMMLAPLGWVSDRLGRKPVLVGGLLVFAAGGFLAGSLEHPVVVVLGRALQGLGAVTAVGLAGIADATSADSRAQGMALVGVGIALAFAAAILVGPPLAAAFGVPWLLTAGGWLGIVAAGVAAAVPLPRQKKSGSAGIVAYLVDARLAVYCAGVFVLHFCMAAVFVVVPLRLAGLLGGDAWMVYLLSFVAAIAVAAPLIVLRGRSDGMICVAAAGVVLAAASSWWLGVMPAWGIGLLLVLFFAGFSYLEAAMPARASMLALPGGRGATMGLYAICQSLGVFAGGAMAGSLGSEYNALGLFIGSGLALVWLVFFRHIQKRIEQG